MKCGAMADNVSVIDEASFMDLLTNGLIDRVGALESKVELLEGKFEVWQKLVESILGAAQTAIAYDSNLIAALGIVFAIVVALVSSFITYWLTKKKEDAIDEAVKKLDDSLSRGILKEGSKARSKIIATMIESDEFTLEVRDIFDYFNKSKDVDSERVNEKQPVENPTIPSDTK